MTWLLEIKWGAVQRSDVINLAKRIWFVQQQPFRYMPLKVGLGLATPEEMRMYAVFNGSAVKEALLDIYQRDCKSLTDMRYNPEMLCPKIYTTRTRPLSGEYYVVEGSRMKATRVEPEIRFKVSQTCKLDLRGYIENATIGTRTLWSKHTILDRNGLTFAELDLGIKHASFEMLRSELLRLNKKATIDTPFFVSLLEKCE
jgi:hypothetical protein